ncbi:MAG: Crp/Fnr family transcriptional regulator [Gammaproteobacteria bacterium]
MPFAKVVPTSNYLLTALPSKDRELLLAHCEPIDLIFTQVLYHAGELIPFVYFPTGSFISLVRPLKGSASLEVGLVGNEGMLGATLALGVDISPFHAVVQGAGSSLRMAVSTFLRELEQFPALQGELKRYLYVSMSQLAQTAACTRYHVVEARLARWLLMTHDRAHSDTFHVTQVFLAYMLGVRRVGITKAANSLQKQKLINYRRGNVTILDRLGLEAVSCECYREEKEIYRRILG